MAILDPDKPALYWTGWPGVLLKPAVAVTEPEPTGTLTDAWPLTPWRLMLPLKFRVAAGLAGVEGARETTGAGRGATRDIAVGNSFELFQVGKLHLQCSRIL